MSKPIFFKAAGFADIRCDCQYALVDSRSILADKFKKILIRAGRVDRILAHAGIQLERHHSSFSA
jgi:hypothetical protein